MIDFAYDVETYPNVFTCVLVHIESGTRWIYEISPWKNQAPELVEMISTMRQHNGRMVGFNNVNFDYPVIHHLVTLHNSQGFVLAEQLSHKANEIINGNDRWGHLIWPSDMLVPQLDLFKIHHFDNVAKATSLKVLEFNMRSHTIEDLPFDPNVPLTQDQVPTLIKYNAHDVNETIRFYHHTAGAIKFREELSEKYGVDYTNFNDTKIGKDFFIMQLEASQPGICFDRSSGRKQPRQTYRRSIPIGPLIFPYVQFQTPELQRVLTYLKGVTITNTKSAPELKDLSATLNGFTFHFGTGGIHGSVTNETIRADAEHDLIDVDVASYYPNLAIVNRVYPEHLSELFCDIYGSLYQQRKGYPKKSAESAMLKLALNGVYGDSNNQYGPFYDPAYTMTITINGQLLICMLAEALALIPGASLVQANTDGVTVKVPKVHRSMFDRVFSDWQHLTGLELESVDYEAMWIRDVNSYVAKSIDGKVKRIGAYAYETAAENPATRELAWHKDHSALVVPKAAEAAMLHGTNPADFIARHDNAWDFMLRAKAPRTSRLELSDGTPLQNTIRYQIAKDGPSLVKIMPPTPKQVQEGKNDPRRIGINVGWSVHVCNKVSDWSWDRLDRAYYVEEAKKLLGMLK